MKMPVRQSGVLASIVESRPMPRMTATMPPTSQRFHTPVRVMRPPITVEDTSRPRIIGMVMRPTWVGVAPRASCMYWAR